MLPDSTYIVLGLGPAGLFVARQIQKAGKTVIGIGKKDDIGRFSNALSNCYVADNASELLHAIKSAADKRDVKLEAIVCSDAYLTWIIEEAPEIFKLLSFRTPDERTLRLFYDKEKLNEVIKESGVPMPAIYERAENVTAFPIVVKPKIKRLHSTLPKISFIHSSEELDNLMILAKKQGYSEAELVFQQMVLGNNAYEYGYGGYFINGEMVNDVAFLQLRQYPQGVSCRAAEINDPQTLDELRSLTKGFLTHLSYSGFIQFDIKKDAQTGQYFVLDVNPRPWGSVSLMTPKGDCADSNIFQSNLRQPRNARWRFPLKELFSIRNKNNVSFSQCRLIEGKNRKTIIDLWDSKDPKPFMMQWLISLIKLVR